MNQYLEHKNDEGELVFRFDKKSKKGKYYVLEGDRQSSALLSPVNFEGFVKLPSGFYKDGYGLTSGGNLAIQEIHKRYDKQIELTVVRPEFTRHSS